MPTIYLDADACPVKDLVFRTAVRYTLPLMVVANTPIRIPSDADQLARAIVVPGWFGFESTTSSGMIALASGLIFLLAWLFSPDQGIVTRRFRRDLAPAEPFSETSTNTNTA